MDLSSFPIGIVRTVWDVVRGVWNFVRRKKRHLPASKVIELRQKWKIEFEDQLWQRRSQKLTTDAIIRDMRRMDSYPDVKTKRGISPWFRIGLMGTYHKGILAGLEWWELIKDEKSGAWRRTDYETDERGLKTILIGYIPYERIEAVDWEGDEFYGLPHIYCYFDDKRKEPYEKLAYCEKREVDNIPRYTEVADYFAVRRATRGPWHRRVWKWFRAKSRKLPT